MWLFNFFWWIIRQVFHYVLLPTLCTMVGILVGHYLKFYNIPVMLQGAEARMEDQQLIIITGASFVSAIIATFIQRFWNFVARALRGESYGRGERKEFI